MPSHVMRLAGLTLLHAMALFASSRAFTTPVATREFSVRMEQYAAPLRVRTWALELYRTREGCFMRLESYRGRTFTRRIEHERYLPAADRLVRLGVLDRHDPRPTGEYTAWFLVTATRNGVSNRFHIADEPQGGRNAGLPLIVRELRGMADMIIRDDSD